MSPSCRSKSHKLHLGDIRQNDFLDGQRNGHHLVLVLDADLGADLEKQLKHTLMFKINKTKYLEINRLAGKKSHPTILFFHAYDDQVGTCNIIANDTDEEGNFNWIFPIGPLKTEFRRAWYACKDTVPEAGHDSWMAYKPIELDETRKQILGTIDELKIPMDRLVLGGYEQGANIAVDIALQLPKPPQGLFVMGGTPICLEEWVEKAKLRPKMKFIQTHGTGSQDYQLGLKLYDLLQGWGWEGEFHPFNGRSAFDVPFLSQVKKFINNLGE